MSSSFKDRVESLVTVMQELALDADKADRGNKAARRRVRVGLNQLRKDAFNLRRDLSDGTSSDSAEG
jgi:hypothetical protein